MTTRTWLYSKLTDPSATALRELIENRVFAKKTMKSSVEEHPYIVFKLGTDSNEALAETVDVHRQFIQIFVHDYSDTEVGDYGRVDSIIAELKKQLVNASSAPDGVISVLYLETSQDLDDQTLSTVFKYIRFQLITKEHTDG